MVSEAEEGVVVFNRNPESVWSAESLPVMWQGKYRMIPLSGSELSSMIEDYSEGEKSLKDICECKGVKLLMVTRLADQFPVVAEALNNAEQARARALEAKAIEPYTMDSEEYFELLSEERYNKEGECVGSGVSSARVAALKQQHTALMRSAAVADRKRYGDTGKGFEVNVGIQNNTVNAGPALPSSLDDLMSMDITSLSEAIEPAEIE